MHVALQDILRLAASLDDECSCSDLATSCAQLLFDDGSDDSAVELLVQIAPLVEKAVLKAAKCRKSGDTETMKHRLKFLFFYQVMDNSEKAPRFRECLFNPGTVTVC